jgi:Spy/CpxP family protein refolding chaperone
MRSTKNGGKKMTKKNILVLCVALVFVFVLSSQSLAFWPGPKKPAKPRPDGMNRIINELNLTPKQKEEFKNHRQEMDKAFKEHRKEIDKYAGKMKEEMQKDRPNRRVVHNCIKNIGDIRVKIQIRRVDSLLKLREGLTKEQRIKFKKMLESRVLDRKISCERNKFNVKLRIRG